MMSHPEPRYMSLRALTECYPVLTQPIPESMSDEDVSFYLRVYQEMQFRMPFVLQSLLDDGWTLEQVNNWKMGDPLPDLS